MSPPLSVSGMVAEGVIFSPTVKPPDSSKTLLLAGAGVRGRHIDGTFVKYMSIGIYIEADAFAFLANKWKGKSADELSVSFDFVRDVVTGPFEKFTRVALINTLTGEQYGRTVGEKCEAIWKASGLYDEETHRALEEFKGIFFGRNFPNGSATLLTHAPSGSFTVGFSTNSSIPEKGVGVVESKALAEAFLLSVMGENGVSPAARRSLAERVCELFKVIEVEEAP